MKIMLGFSKPVAITGLLITTLNLIQLAPASALIAPPPFYSKITSPLAQAAAGYASIGEPFPPTIDDASTIQHLCTTDSSSASSSLVGIDEATVATFAGGCFWGIQKAYDNEPGVLATCVGYTQGDDTNSPHPSYADICSEETGHAEACLVLFDPSLVTYARLSDVLFECLPDPTMLNRAGKDRGTQYRSGMYAHSDEQLEEAKKAYDKENRMWQIGGRTVVTEVRMAGAFWPAEEEHQRYLAKGSGRRC